MMLASGLAPRPRPVPALRDIASGLPLCHASVRAAFEDEQFTVAYQPILRADTLAPVACEALLRWTHPTRGEQKPRDFVPILERSALVLEVGDWMLGEVTAQIRDWDQQGFPALRVSINVATIQLMSPDFPVQVQRALHLAGLAPERLVLEISQDAVHQRPDVGAALARLAQLGVSVDLDDFGGGPSMLGRMKALSLSGFKVDRRFLADITAERPSSREDVRILAGMARNLGLRCTAEGVQSEEELQALRGFGVGEVQGFLFCGALAPPAFERFLHAQAAVASRVTVAAGGMGRA